MAKVIIGIHGLANKPSKTTLSDWWEKSLIEGLKVNCGIKNPSFNFTMVYWADLLYKYQLHQDNNFTFDKLYNHEPYKPAPKGALKQYKESWLDRARKAAQGALGNTADKVRGYLGLDAVGDFLLKRVLKDLFFYYDPSRRLSGRDGKRGKARLVLQKDLEEAVTANKNTDIMLIAHSMGSIIAYDVLRNLGRTNLGISVSHFVTIGSPLGLPHVMAKINEERKYDRRVRTPSIVTKSWLNFADRKDPVAFDTHLRDDYQPNSKKVQVKDDLVLNDYTIGGKTNHHKSYGYLRTPEMSRHVKAFLKL